jgi:hypothetical protein
LNGAFLVVRNGKTAFLEKGRSGFEVLNQVFGKKKNGLGTVNKGVMEGGEKKSEFILK